MCTPYYQVTENEGRPSFTTNRDYAASYHAGASCSVHGLMASGIARQIMPKDVDLYLLCSILGTALSDSLQLRLQPVSRYLSL